MNYKLGIEDLEQNILLIWMMRGIFLKTANQRFISNF